MRQVQYCQNCGYVSVSVPMKKPCCPECAPFDLPENIARQARAGFLSELYLLPAAADVLKHNCAECRLNLESAIIIVEAGRQ